MRAERTLTQFNAYLNEADAKVLRKLQKALMRNNRVPSLSQTLIECLYRTARDVGIIESIDVPYKQLKHRKHNKHR